MPKKRTIKRLGVRKKADWQRIPEKVGVPEIKEPSQGRSFVFSFKWGVVFICTVAVELETSGLRRIIVSLKKTTSLVMAVLLRYLRPNSARTRQR